MGQAKQRKQEIEQLKAQGPKSKTETKSGSPIAKDGIVGYSFFYSPTDSVDDVLSISCSDSGESPFSNLPLKVGRIAWDGIPELDEQYAIHGQKMVDDFFFNINQMRNKVLTHNRLKTGHVMSVNETIDMALIAGQICWLTMRGFIKQSEYNGTMVVSLYTGTSAMPAGFVLPQAPQPSARQGEYSPNDVKGHYRTRNGKTTFIRAYHRGN